MSSSSPAPRAPSPSPSPTCGASGLDFHRAVLSALSRMPSHGQIDQPTLRTWLLLAPSWLVLDSSSGARPVDGIAVWVTGVQALVNVMLALHARGTLEFETVDAASRALQECWSIVRCWAGLDFAEAPIRQMGAKLMSVLDADGRCYKGRVVYTP